MKTEDRIRRKMSELYNDVAESNLDKQECLAKINILEWVLDP